MPIYFFIEKFVANWGFSWIFCRKGYKKLGVAG